MFKPESRYSPFNEFRIKMLKDILRCPNHGIRQRDCSGCDAVQRALCIDAKKLALGYITHLEQKVERLEHCHDVDQIKMDLTGG